MLKIPLSALCLSFFLFSSANACTVFATTGGKDLVEGGGTLVAKVRDETRFRHEVKTVVPETGYAYRGLFNGRYFNMGVNEKGLVVFRTTAGSVPKDVRKNSERFKTDDHDRLAGSEYLIRNCATVDEALSHTEVFKEPTNYMIADPHKIAFVEVLPGGKFVVRTKDRGSLTHTNHYITPESESANVKIGKSSLMRFNRINRLMEEKKKPYTFEDFIEFTENKTDNPDDSIMRLGEISEDHPKTLATMVVYLPPKGDPKMYLKWRDSMKNYDDWHQETLTLDFAKEKAKH